MSVVGGDVAGFVAERESELRLIVHQAEQLAGDVDIAAGHRQRILDRRIERHEMKRLAGVGEARGSGDAAADRFDICRSRARFGAAELLNQFGILALRFGDVARIEVARPLRARRSESGSTGRDQEQDFAHSPFHCAREYRAAILNGE